MKTREGREEERVFLGNGVWSGFYLAATRRWPHCSLMLANPAKSGTADESGTVSALLWTPCEKCDLVREERFGNSSWPPPVTGGLDRVYQPNQVSSFSLSASNEMLLFFFLSFNKRRIDHFQRKNKRNNWIKSWQIEKYGWNEILLKFDPIGFDDTVERSGK